MTRRNIELALLCIAAPMVILVFAMLVVNEGQSLQFETLAVPIGLFIAFIAAHITTRIFAPAADPAILPITFALAGIGIAFVTRLAPNLAVNQVIWLFTGVGAMILVLAFSKNMDKISNYKYSLMLVGFILLMLPMVIGVEKGGSKLWLEIGSYSFQPGELAKILIVLFLAGYLASNRELLSIFTMRVGPFRLPDIQVLSPMLVMWVMALLIVIFERDLGSAVVFFFVFLSMLYAATGKKFYLVIGVLLIIVGCFGAYQLFGHVQTRVNNWLDPFADPQGAGYQMVQALYSIADGDLFGVGIGRGLASQIPVVESDFIFAAIAEECGLLGAAGVLLLYFSFAIRGFVTAARAKSDFSCFVAVGLTTVISLQAFIIVGGVTGLIPLTGLTLPFISQGGSSLLSSFICVGFLLRCGDEGTGVSKEMTNAIATRGSHQTGVLGRVSLGKRLTHIITIFAVIFALLVANLTYVMIARADELKNMPGNDHTLIHEATLKRGSITTADGTILAQSILNDDGTYSRTYPAGNLASQVIGYYSNRYGSAGIEAYANEILKGQLNYATWLDVLNSEAGIQEAGNDVVLTLDSTIQQAAQDALSGYTGAAVAIDPQTGAILGMASSPTYNTADFAQVLQAAGDAAGADNNGDQADADDDGDGASSGDGSESVLLNRATQSLYAPGSTFKIVSLATALENGTATEDSMYNSPGTMDIGNAKVSSFDGIDYGYISLRRATEVSSNTVFGQLGEQMGAAALVTGAQAFGFDKDIDFDLPLATSVMSDPEDMTIWETAWAAAGQPVGEHAVSGPYTSVLQMALTGCAIANEGTINKPYLIDSVYNANGERSYTAQKQTLYQAVSAAVANRVKDVLVGVVQNGTGTNAAIPGITVAGKTGTAETGKALDDSWFVGMAPAENPQIVVAIVLEQAVDDEYDLNAAARAKNLLETSLEVVGAR